MHIGLQPGAPEQAAHTAVALQHRCLQAGLCYAPKRAGGAAAASVSLLQALQAVSCLLLFYLFRLFISHPELERVAIPYPLGKDNNFLTFLKYLSSSEIPPPPIDLFLPGFLWRC